MKQVAIMQNVLWFQAGMIFCIFLSAPLQLAAIPSLTLREIQQLIQKGDLANARAHLTEILKTLPRDPMALNLMGVVNAQEGKYHDAEDDFRRAIAAAPDFADAYLNLGRLYQENAPKDPEALKKSLFTYKSLLRFDPSSLEANYQAAILLWRTGSFESSLDMLSRLPESAQERPQAVALRCADYAGLKDNRQAEEMADRLVHHPALAEVDVLAILPTLLVHHDEELALKLLAGLDQLGLASADTLHQLGLLHEQQGSLKLARATLEKEVQIRGAVTVPRLIELARVAYKDGDHDGALGYLAHARDLEPNNASVHFFFGMACLEKRLLQEAFVSLKNAADLNPDNPYYNYAAGAVMMSRRDVREGYLYLKKYSALKPDDPRGHLALGAAYFYGHDTDLARKEFESVVSNPQTSTVAHYFLGRLANQQGRYEEAIRDLRQAIRESPQYAEAYTEMGLIYMKEKQYGEAEMNLMKALELDPQSYTANFHLLILYERTKDLRAEVQRMRFNQTKQLGEQREMEFLRTIDVRPY